MHVFTIVLIPADTQDIKAAVNALLERFSDEKRVEAYKGYVKGQKLQQMAEFYGLPETDLPALASHLKGYYGADEAGVDEGGLYYISTRNPQGRWDYWVIGGRWDGVIQGKSRNTKGRSNYGPEHEQLQYNICPVRELPADVLPEWILTPDGKWYEQEMRSLYPTPQENEAWRKVVQPLLEQYQDCFAVGVDCHL